MGAFGFDSIDYGNTRERVVDSQFYRIINDNSVVEGQATVIGIFAPRALAVAA